MPLKLGSPVSARALKLKVDDCERLLRSGRSRMQRALERDSQYGAGLHGPSASSLSLYLRPYRPRATGNDAPDAGPKPFSTLNMSFRPTTVIPPSVPCTRECS